MLTAQLWCLGSQGYATISCLLRHGISWLVRHAILTGETWNFTKFHVTKFHVSKVQFKDSSKTKKIKKTCIIESFFETKTLVHIDGSNQWLLERKTNVTKRSSTVLQGVNKRAVCCSVLQCVAVCCSVLQCVAVCCSVLQCVAVSTRLVEIKTDVQLLAFGVLFYLTLSNGQVHMFRSLVKSAYSRMYKRSSAASVLLSLSASHEWMTTSSSRPFSTSCLRPRPSCPLSQISSVRTNWHGRPRK